MLLTTPSPRPLRMVATDLDGTIIPHGRTISDRTRAALEACEEAGVQVVYVTGRPPRWLAPVVAATSASRFAICANGSITLDLQTDAIFSLHAISNDVVLEVAHRLRSAVPDVVFAVETAHGLRVEAGYEAARGQGPAEGLAPPRGGPHDLWSAGTLEELLDDEPLIKMVAISAGSTPDGLLAAGRTHVTDLVAPTHSSPGLALLEMGPLGVTKASSLGALARAWGIDAADVVSFGDMPNDIEMLRWAGTSYAMSGGHADAIAAAGNLAPPAGEDGVAQVLERMLRGD
ncbi:HAD family hydrolase [Pengzhenrongella frigida]|uniref:HAD family hydrolase n=1 Tax=Pengzhenrongella frigida TaxID=1259133 RepID=A0A4Q5N219_9MICO|nr:HAD family hydrolase [Cellulomonas sp. HLT2-17]RYV50081.1 HAD family hydrolase [Cellulomonas sp. HLT2-17]